ncbi:MAG: helix-turn-helix domain-containing protein [Candidatus Paceibacterota bacterium]
MKLNTNKFAKLCNVSTGTIRYWARKNKLNFEYTKGGQRRFDESEVINFLNKSKRNTIFVIEDLKLYNTSTPEYHKAWRNNKNKCRAYSRNRNHKNLELSAIKWMRNFLYRTEKQGFNKTKLNTITEFGYTPKQLINRIEYQFKNGMSWNNRKEWHIDHKKPISKFTKETSPRIINMLCNLQPIWATENLSKNNKF